MVLYKKMNFQENHMIRKATEKDIDSIAVIYEHIHEEEKKGNITTGWIAGVYPVRETAAKGVERGDMFVYEDEEGIKAAAVLNKLQVDVYADCEWEYDASDDEVMVIHTLVVEPEFSKGGIGRKFVKYYEEYGRENGCKVLRMDTNERNVIARKFYAGLGYTEPGIVPCVFNGIPDVQLVLLEKQL